jgi:hypothetical protein
MAQNRWIDFYEGYIPKDLPEKPVPDENGRLIDWQDTKEGQIHIIDFLVDEAIKVIMDRPENKVLEFQLNKLGTTIDIWTKEWEREFALLALAYFYKYDISESTDAYMTLYPIAYPINEKAPIESYKWISHKVDLKDALDILQPLSYLFKGNSLEGLKIALSGSDIFAMKGCLEPSSNNQRAVLYLIYNLCEHGFIKETRNMEVTAKVLISANCSYRRHKSLFSKGEYTLDKTKENHIETLVGSLSKM